MFIFISRSQDGKTFNYSFYNNLQKVVYLGRIIYTNVLNERETSNKIKIIILKSRRWYAGPMKAMARDCIRNKRQKGAMFVYKINWVQSQYSLTFVK